jgi:hypothetical protein
MRQQRTFLGMLMAPARAGVRAAARLRRSIPASINIARAAARARGWPTGRLHVYSARGQLDARIALRGACIVPQPCKLGLSVQCSVRACASVCVCPRAPARQQRACGASERARAAPAVPLSSRAPAQQ